MDEKRLIESLGRMMDEKLDKKLDEKLTPIYSRLDGMETRLTKLEMDNENIIIPNIQKLAEGYAPLYEKVLEQGVTLVL